MHAMQPQRNHSTLSCKKKTLRCLHLHLALCNILYRTALRQNLKEINSKMMLKKASAICGLPWPLELVPIVIWPNSMIQHLNLPILQLDPIYRPCGKWTQNNKISKRSMKYIRCFNFNLIKSISIHLIVQSGVPNYVCMYTVPLNSTKMFEC